MLKQPRIEPHPTIIGKYILLENYVYKWKKFGRFRKLVIPKGFVTDLASVPRIAWTFSGITPGHLKWAAPICHDYPYQYKGVLPPGSYFIKMGGEWTEDRTKWKRKDTDRLFFRIMREDGIPQKNRRRAFKGVRVGGWFSWREWD